MKKNKARLSIFRGKRVYESVVGAHGISRLYVWDFKENKYKSPDMGKPYNARRYSFKNGTKKREHVFFSTLEEARCCQV